MWPAQGPRKGSTQDLVSRYELSKQKIWGSQCLAEVEGGGPRSEQLFLLNLGLLHPWRGVWLKDGRTGLSKVQGPRPFSYKSKGNPA